MKEDSAQPVYLHSSLWGDLFVLAAMPTCDVATSHGQKTKTIVIAVDNSQASQA